MQNFLRTNYITSPKIAPTQQQQISTQTTTRVAAIIRMQSQGQQLLQQQQNEQQRHQQMQHRHTLPQLIRRITIAPQAVQQHKENTKEKCRTFLENLIYLSKREPKPLEDNVRSLIQDLVNEIVEPEEFCDGLVRLISVRPQPNLVGFLKISLPLLRQALFRKELDIKDIRSPTQHGADRSALTQQLPKRIRLISPYQDPRSVGRTTITKEQRIQAFASAPGWPDTDMRVRYSELPRAMQQQLHMNFPQSQFLESEQSMGATIPGSGTARGKANLASIGGPALMSQPNASSMLSAPNFNIDFNSAMKILSETTFTAIEPATPMLLSTKTQGIE